MEKPVYVQENIGCLWCEKVHTFLLSSMQSYKFNCECGNKIKIEPLKT